MDSHFKDKISLATWDRIESKAAALGEIGFEKGSTYTEGVAQPIDNTTSLESLALLESNSTTTSSDWETSSPHRKKAALSFLFIDDHEVTTEVPVSVQEKAANELMKNLQIGPKTSEENPLMYRKTNRERLPMLSTLARSVLFVQASSVQLHELCTQT